MLEDEKANAEAIRGRLAPHACSMLMKVLYGSRFARMDLLRMFGFLAQTFHRWTTKCDTRLHRLMCYLHTTVHAIQFGWCGDTLDQINPFLYADADLAGCVSTQRATNGNLSCVRGKNTFWPISGCSKRQGCVSCSSAEAEIVSTAYALKNVGLPGLDLWSKLLPHKPKTWFLEDNQAMLQCIKTGKNPTMRYLLRTHRISIAWLNEVYKSGQL